MSAIDRLRVLARPSRLMAATVLAQLWPTRANEFNWWANQVGMSRVAAVLESCRLRLRPILMTSFAFIMGVVPLVLSSGAGAEMRHAMGVAVFSGMLGVTFFGLLLTPLFFVLIRGFVEKREARKAQQLAQEVHV